MTTFPLPFPPPCPCGSTLAQVWVSLEPTPSAYWKCNACGRLMGKANAPGKIRTESERQDMADLMRRYLPKAEGSRLYGMPIADMSRDELLAIAVWFCERECEKYRMPTVSDLTGSGADPASR